MENILRLLQAIKVHAFARKAVMDWMNAEGREGKLRTNNQAPGWPAYEIAQREYSIALTAVERDFLGA